MVDLAAARGSPELAGERRPPGRLRVRGEQPAVNGDAFIYLVYLLSVPKGHKRFQGCPQTFWFFRDYDTILPSPFCLVESFIGPAE